jgi:hypothetical protein
MQIELWTLVDELMKWVIIPMAAILWVHNQKLGSHARCVPACRPRPYYPGQKMMNLSPINPSRLKSSCLQHRH